MIRQRNNVRVLGQGERVLMLAHGFGCDQRVFRFIVPMLAERFRLVLFDYVGAGGADLAAFDPERYAELDGYARDIVEILEALALRDVTLVGHSVSGIIGLLAALEAPGRIGRLRFLPL